MTSFAVTAASGQLGGEIVRALVRSVGQERVVGLARTPGKAEALGVEVRPGDYGEPEVLKGSLQGIEVLLLVSGMDAPEKRIAQHRNVLGAAREAGVRKVVYTSIQGAEEGTAFSPIVQSNRATEEDVRGSGLEWAIGRNGIYIEPDLEALEAYTRAGEIANCADGGRCGYTTRQELAHAYARLMVDSERDGGVYNLHGARITQQELAGYLNEAFGLELEYRAMSVEEYRQDRVAELGEFLGGVIAGIYEGIRLGASDNESHFAVAAGREHQSWAAYFEALKAGAN